ncbi:unnamed protein product [Prunus armeniaca]|uniref:Uncharacterized protein n=1 Tax=Prunus armeniaca TaxID=36596 RepID=A0A6J5XRE8_PRUAR|nr:unnamed protein product [Prunus armeniaca]
MGSGCACDEPLNRPIWDHAKFHSALSSRPSSPPSSHSHFSYSPNFFVISIVSSFVSQSCALAVARSHRVGAASHLMTCSCASGRPLPTQHQQ